MQVRATRIIRSAHLDALIILPGELGEVLTETVNLGRKTTTVKWARGVCTVLPQDIELVDSPSVVAVPAATATPIAMTEPPPLRPITLPVSVAVGSEQEPVGTLLHPIYSAWLKEFDIGGES